MLNRAAIDSPAAAADALAAAFGGTICIWRRPLATRTFGADSSEPTLAHSARSPVRRLAHWSNEQVTRSNCSLSFSAALGGRDWLPSGRRALIGQLTERARTQTPATRQTHFAWWPPADVRVSCRTQTQTHTQTWPSNSTAPTGRRRRRTRERKKMRASARISKRREKRRGARPIWQQTPASKQASRQAERTLQRRRRRARGRASAQVHLFELRRAQCAPPQASCSAEAPLNGHLLHACR